jgi:tripartite-type tricarboxylate transporter receptor subunit TctC
MNRGICMIRLLAAMAIMGAAASGIGTATAQEYPSRPITIVVAFAPGGSTDVVARVVGERMASSLGQAVIIENVTGADGVIGTGRVARAQPDGYTLNVGTLASNVLNGAAYPLSYDLVKDFEPIALLSTNPYLLITRKTVPANNLLELVAWIKVNQDHVSLGAASMNQRVIGALFQKLTGTRLLFVPYRGGGPALQDLIAGQIDVLFDQPTNSISQVRSGSAKALAVAAATRLPAAPEIPTADEAGLPGLHILSWNAIFAPKNTPKAIIAKLNAAVVDALRDPTVRARFFELGTDIPPRDQLTPEWLGNLQRSDIEKWWPIVREANIRGG